MKRINYKEGDRIHNVVYLQEAAPRKIKRSCMRRAIFRCVCGNEFESSVRAVRDGKASSCGCYQTSSRFLRIKHGMARVRKHHDVYRSLANIKTRCYNTKRKDYKNYGGIGICVSDEFHDFITFYNYVSNLPKFDQRQELKLTIDRINVTKNYERGNLRWATRTEQNLNQRRNAPYLNL